MEGNKLGDTETTFLKELENSGNEKLINAYREFASELSKTQKETIKELQIIKEKLGIHRF